MILSHDQQFLHSILISKHSLLLLLFPSTANTTYIAVSNPNYPMTSSTVNPMFMPISMPPTSMPLMSMTTFTTTPLPPLIPTPPPPPLPLVAVNPNLHAYPMITHSIIPSYSYLSFPPSQPAILPSNH
jgi:hypothetical protein